MPSRTRKDFGEDTISSHLFTKLPNNLVLSSITSNVFMNI